ncbi:MAG: alpha/beta fold hydrolase, partial [Planctomycetota bacterium]
MSRKRTWIRRALIAYVVLLILSHVVRWNTEATRPLAPGTRAVAVREVSRDGPGERTVTIAYGEHRPASTSGRTPVVLIHGSPGRRQHLEGVAVVLGSRRRVFSLDLPGFGESTRDLPDYSIRAHAQYVVQFLDALEIAQAHVVGYSMGGGVALHVADLVPDRVRSLSLLSAIGVQELQLLGNYYVNHALHGIQLGAIWLSREALPHFGLLDDVLVGVPYA